MIGQIYSIDFEIGIYPCILGYIPVIIALSYAYQASKTNKLTYLLYSERPIKRRPATTCNDLLSCGQNERLANDCRTTQSFISNCKRQSFICCVKCADCRRNQRMPRSFATSKMFYLLLYIFHYISATATVVLLIVPK